METVLSLFFVVCSESHIELDVQMIMSMQTQIAWWLVALNRRNMRTREEGRDGSVVKKDS